MPEHRKACVLASQRSRQKEAWPSASSQGGEGGPEKLKQTARFKYHERHDTASHKVCKRHHFSVVPPHGRVSLRRGKKKLGQAYPTIQAVLSLRSDGLPQKAAHQDVHDCKTNGNRTEAAKTLARLAELS